MNIFDILIREKLGVETDSTLGVSGSSIGVMAVAGCKNPTAGPLACHPENDGLLDKPLGHVILTAWEPYFSSNWHKLPHATRPFWVGTIGYRGFDGLFAPKSAIDTALRDDGWDLMYHTFYDARWRQPWKYFDSYVRVMEVGGADGSKPEPCTEQSEATGTNADIYFQLTGDADGVEQGTRSDGTVLTVMKCNADGWFFTPLARDNPEVKGIPVITYGSWAMDKFGQKAYFSNMPFAESSWSWGKYVEIPQLTTILFYFWYPDATFVRIDPQLVIFPPSNQKEQREGNYRTAQVGMKIYKLAVPGLEGADDDVYTFLEDFQMSLADVNDFIVQADVDGDSHFDVACKWIKDNPAIWLPWIPDVDRCAFGTGYSEQTGVCELCQAGFVSVYDEDVGNQACAVCRAGYYCTMGATFETPCDAGFFCEEGSSKPAPCGIGESNGLVGMSNSSSCLDCAPGTYASREGLSMCDQCLEGYKSEKPGAGLCDPCPVGYFQDFKGANKCERCQEGFVTTLMGAGSDDLCVCQLGYFYSESADKCIQCGTGLVCPGGKDMPYIGAGYYAEPKRTERSGQWAWDSGERIWSYSKSSSAFTGPTDGLFHEHTVWKCKYADIACPGKTYPSPTGDIKNARKVDVCNTNDWACAQKQGCTGNLWKNGCTRCEDHYYYSKGSIECLECGDGQGAIFPIVLAIGLGVLFAMYKFASLERSQKITTPLILASSVSIVASFFQLLGVIGFYNVEFPRGLSTFFDFCKVFVLDIDVLKAACASGSGFGSRYLARTVSPLLFVGCFAVCMPLSAVLSKVVGAIEAMSQFKMLNVVGIVFSALYITLCKVSFQFFENAAHPNAPGVLAAYADVDYDSDDRRNMLPWAIIATMIYAVGIYVGTVYLCFIAPSKKCMNDKFLTSTAFLTVRWTPNRWYWTVVVQTRNLFVALVAVWYPSTTIMQLVMTGAVVAMYTATAAAGNPWRDSFLSNADSVIGLAITLMCLFATVLCVKPNEPAQRTMLENAGMSYLTFVVVVSMVTFLYVVALSFMYFIKPDMKKNMQMEFAQEVATTVYLVSDLIIEAQKTPEEYAEDFLHYTTKAEQIQMLYINKALLHEVHGIDYDPVQGGFASRRMMSKKIDTPRVSRKSFAGAPKDEEGGGGGKTLTNVGDEKGTDAI